ncbi:MAG: hypothetical protein IKQ41_00030 [Clostridia bacterium]|nr:hypothetical protein [Clostridia bacterium]
MSACIARYTTEKGKLMEAFQICVQASNLLAQSWAGPSFLACSAKMAATYANLFQSEQKMDDAIEELRNVINIMDGAETKIQGEVNSLEVGESPFA